MKKSVDKWCFLCKKYIGKLDYGQTIEHTCDKCKKECESKNHYDQIVEHMFGAYCARCGKSYYDIY
jgi:hypothetical protein